MKNLLLAVAAMMACSTLFADCKEYALQGDWSVFYRDNAFPTSVLAADETVDIQYDARTDQFSVALTDADWKAWGGRWSHECIDGQTILIGAVESRHGGSVLVIEVSRVTDVADLMARSSGKVRLSQINIHFPERHASSYPPELREALAENDYIAAHPGHAHGDND